MQATGANAEPSEVDGLKVMVIDDSNTIRRSAEIFLLQAGCQVILAEDGFDALAKIADHRPDVIFVDIMMPRLDGYLTCALIKKNAKFKSTPVVMLSSKDGLFDRARGRMVGSDQYLTKPFTLDALKELLHRWLPERLSSNSTPDSQPGVEPDRVPSQLPESSHAQSSATENEHVDAHAWEAIRARQRPGQPAPRRGATSGRRWSRRPMRWFTGRSAPLAGADPTRTCRARSW